MDTVGELPIDNRIETVEYDLTLETALRRMFGRGHTQIGDMRNQLFHSWVEGSEFDRDLLRFWHSYFSSV